MKQCMGKVAILGWLILFWGVGPAFADEAAHGSCPGLPTHAALQAALQAVVSAGGNGGLSNEGIG
jgi:hypothetical protein